MLIRPGAIGDCILSLPALEFLKSGYTEIWAPSAVVPLIRFADRVRSITSTGLDMVFDQVPAGLADRFHEFDEIVSWYGANRQEFRAALSAVHPRCTFLTALPESGTEHATDFFLRQVGALPGSIPQIHIQPEDRRDSVVIHPFSGSARKNWPFEKFTKLVGRLQHPEWAQDRFDDLFSLAVWMKGAKAYVGNDSGITHLAAAIGLPGVALFGLTDPAVWGPRGEQIRILRHNPLAELPVEMVWEALIGC